MVLATSTVQVTMEAMASEIITAFTTMSASRNMLQGERSWGSKLAPTALLSVPDVPTEESAPCAWARNAGIKKAPTTTNVMNARRARVLGQRLVCVSVIL